MLLYGAEVWRCCRQTDPLSGSVCLLNSVQVQLRAARIYWGVGRLQPRSAIVPTFLLRCEDLKQEREAVVGCMMKLESDFLTATNEKKIVMILDQACRNVHVGKSIKKLWQRRFDHLN